MKIYDFIFIGGHDERKGVSDLLKAFAIVLKEIPEAKLITCGIIPQENKTKLYNLV
jgi:glycosyltransferase involved in cell wall biosynthesis